MSRRLLKALRTLDRSSVFHRPSVRGAFPSPQPPSTRLGTGPSTPFILSVAERSRRKLRAGFSSRGEGVVIPSPLRLRTRQFRRTKALRRKGPGNPLLGGVAEGRGGFPRPARAVVPTPPLARHPSKEGIARPRPVLPSNCRVVRRGEPRRGNCKGGYYRTLLLLLCCLSLLLAPSVWAQGGVGVGGDRPSAKTRRFPFKVVVTGFLNTDPAPDALAVIQLGVTGYRGDFQLEVTNITAPNSPQLTPRQIFLHRAGKRKADLDVTGPRDTLAKIAQAQPGTPLELTGWYAQRDGEFRLENVRIVGFE